MRRVVLGLALGLGLSSGAAVAAVPLELPPGEEVASWGRAAELAGLSLGAAGACPWVRMGPTATGWRIEVCDVEGQQRDATIGRPRSLPEREAAVLLAQSLLRPAGVALPGIRPAVPPPPEADEGSEAASEGASTASRPRRSSTPAEAVVEESTLPPPPEPTAEEVAAEGVVDLTRRRRRRRDPTELDIDTDDDAPPGGVLEPGALDAEPSGWAAWWTVLGVGRVWEGTEPDLGARLRLGLGLPSGWRVGLDAQTGPARTLLLDESLALRQQSFALGAWTPGLGPTRSYLSGRLGIGFMRPVYDNLDLRRVSAPVIEVSGGLPFATAEEWAVVVELGGSAHLRGLELRWPDGRTETLPVWQAELALGLRVGRVD